MEVHLARIIVVAVNDPVCAERLSDRVQTANLGIDRDAFVVGPELEDPPLVVIVEAVLGEGFQTFGFRETARETQTDLLAAGSLDHDVSHGLEHLCIGRTAHHPETVFRAEDIERVLRFDLRHVDAGKGTLSGFANGRWILAVVVNGLVDVGEELAHVDGDHLGKFRSAHRRQVKPARRFGKVGRCYGRIECHRLPSSRIAGNPMFGSRPVARVPWLSLMRYSG